MANGQNGEGSADGQQPNAGGGQGNQGGQQNAPQSGQSGVAGDQGQGNGQGGQQQARKKFEFDEDRSDWVPRHRITEQGQKLTAAEQRALKAETDLEAERARVRALAGVQPQDPAAAEEEQLRAVLYKLVPGLKHLEKFTAEQLEEVIDAANTARSASSAQWERHALGMLESAETDIAKQMGVDKLTPRQSQRIRSAYIEEAQAAALARQRAEANGEAPDPANFLTRHERGDKTLIAEFVKNYLEDWFEPARRSVTARQVQRTTRPVPRGERTRQMPAGTPPKVDLNDKQAFKDALIAARNASA